jgi:uncharacterized membrane protein YecN with MAPEG domain
MKLLYLSIGLLGLMAAALALNVARMRGRKRIFLGDGGDKEMLSAIRAHANFIEFVPLGLILILTVMDFYGGPTSGIMAGALLIARILHAGGMLGYIPNGRVMGAVGSVGVLVAASLWILLAALGHKPY